MIVPAAVATASCIQRSFRNALHQRSKNGSEQSAVFARSLVGRWRGTGTATTRNQEELSDEAETLTKHGCVIGGNRHGVSPRNRRRHDRRYWGRHDGCRQGRRKHRRPRATALEGPQRPKRARRVAAARAGAGKAGAIPTQRSKRTAGTNHRPGRRAELRPCHSGSTQVVVGWQGARADDRPEPAPARKQHEPDTEGAARPDPGSSSAT